MILTTFFQKVKLKVNEEMQIIMPNATIMTTVSILHKMYLTLGDNGCWVRAHTAPPPPPMPPTVGKGSFTQTLVVASNDMFIAQSHAPLLEEMGHLHVYLINKLTA